MIADHDAPQPQLIDGPFHFRNCTCDILHREDRQPCKPIRVVPDKRGDLIVTVAVNSKSIQGSKLIAIHLRFTRYDLGVHPVTFHISNAVVHAYGAEHAASDDSWINPVQKIACAKALDQAPGREVRVQVNYRHELGILRPCDQQRPCGSAPPVAAISRPKLTMKRSFRNELTLGSAG